jgi:hypothetical protein
MVENEIAKDEKTFRLVFTVIWIVTVARGVLGAWLEGMVRKGWRSRFRHDRMIWISKFRCVPGLWQTVFRRPGSIVYGIFSIYCYFNV